MIDTRPRLLLPHEHGTYGELLFPLASAVVLASPTLASWGLAACAISGFLAHEGFAVLIGVRGGRARRDSSTPALASVALFGGLAVIGAVAAWSELSASAIPGLILAAGLSLTAIGLAWMGYERTLAGELVAVVALSAWSVPVALAGALPFAPTMAMWLIWVGLFATATCAVHIVIARTRNRSTRLAWALGCLLAGLLPTLLAWAIARGDLPAAALVITIPGLASFFGLTLGTTRATHLRHIGWTVIGVSLLTLALMVVVLG